ncbi:MAG: hypothetical protein IKD18_06115, partial [Clostridia bacterium]|nr:hypothetical protein [Clostridia bacterium]
MEKEKRMWYNDKKRKSGGRAKGRQYVRQLRSLTPVLYRSKEEIMKKWIALALTLSMLFPLCACASQEPPTQ